MVAVLAVAASPCCFPALAFVGGFIGLGFLAPHETYVGYALQFVALIMAAVGVIDFVRRRQFVPMLAAMLAAALILFAYHVRFSASVIYAGLIAMAVSSVWRFIFDPQRHGRASSLAPTTRSIITCPTCGHRSEEEMPTNACLFFYDCPQCNARLKPKPGDCCVFCSYGSVPCPPIQIGTACCSA